MFGHSQTTRHSAFFFTFTSGWRCSAVQQALHANEGLSKQLSPRSDTHGVFMMLSDCNDFSYAEHNSSSTLSDSLITVPKFIDVKYGTRRTKLAHSSISANGRY